MANSTSTKSQCAVTMKEIAVRCGVTQATVSRALNNDPHVNVNTAAHIQAVATEMGYDLASQQYARRLVQRRYGKQPLNQLIAVFCPQYFQSGHYYPPILQGSYDITTPADYGVCVGTFNHTVQGDRFPLQSIISRGDVDGLLLLRGSFFSEADLEKVRMTPGFRNRPIVSLFAEHPGCSSVIFDEEQMVSLTIHHLLELGHRHILHLSYPDANGGTGWKRIQIARRIMASAGLSPDTFLHILPIPLDPDWGDPDLPQVNGQTDYLKGEVLINCLRVHPNITAIIGVNDASALYAWYTLRQAGINVPEDISIVGADDTDPMRDAFGRNVLTSVRVPLDDLGREGTRVLLRRISGEAEQDTNVVLPVELMLRESTAPPRKTRLFTGTDR